VARMTLEQIKAMRPKTDRRKIDATTEKDIARHMREDREASSTSAIALGEE
jgi:putative transcriptional regulator